ncbi:MAG: hypothetical protein ABIJ18_04335 [archaeon]
MTLDMTREEFGLLLSEKDIVDTLNKISPQVQIASGQHIHVIQGARNTCSQLLEAIKEGNVQSKTWGEFEKEPGDGFYGRCVFLLYKAFVRNIYQL